MKDVKKIVFDILSKDKKARNSDEYLYMKVLARKNKDVLRMDVHDFLTSGSIRNGVPSIESVSRCRRKLQSEFPALKASSTVREYRNELRKKFKFA